MKKLWFALFTFISDGNLDAIYDVTIAYPDNLPETEADLAYGSIPSEIHFHIKRYYSTLHTLVHQIKSDQHRNFKSWFFRHSVQTVPTTWIGLEKWLQEVWREKDALPENVYDRQLKLPALTSRQHLPQPILPIQVTVRQRTQRIKLINSFFVVNPAPFR